MKSVALKILGIAAIVLMTVAYSNCGGGASIGFLGSKGSTSGNPIVALSLDPYTSPGVPFSFQICLSSIRMGVDGSNWQTVWTGPQYFTLSSNGIQLPDIAPPEQSFNTLGLVTSNDCQGFNSNVRVTNSSGSFTVFETSGVWIPFSALGFTITSGMNIRLSINAFLRDLAAATSVQDVKDALINNMGSMNVGASTGGTTGTTTGTTGTTTGTTGSTTGSTTGTTGSTTGSTTTGSTTGSTTGAVACTGPSSVTINTTIGAVTAFTVPGLYTCTVPEDMTVVFKGVSGGGGGAGGDSNGYVSSYSMKGGSGGAAHRTGVTRALTTSFSYNIRVGGRGQGGFARSGGNDGGATTVVRSDATTFLNLTGGGAGIDVAGGPPGTGGEGNAGNGGDGGSANCGSGNPGSAGSSSSWSNPGLPGDSGGADAGGAGGNGGGVTLPGVAGSFGAGGGGGGASDAACDNNEGPSNGKNGQPGVVTITILSKP